MVSSIDVSCNVDSISTVGVFSNGVWVRIGERGIDFRGEISRLGLLFAYRMGSFQ